jgi:RNA polymerase sigma factor (sigma-70 family)
VRESAVGAALQPPLKNARLSGARFFMSDFRAGGDYGASDPMDDDRELLRRYGTQATDAQAAFAALVQRHLDLVYSVARRTVRDPHLAADVAQSVFLELARGAARFPSGTPVVAWLHVVTHRTAVDLVRSEARRTARERAAAELADPATSAAWREIEPLLDEAVAALPPADRAAILLRFFENRSLRDVGAALGLSDDTAQKRVSRALERLRTFFAHRGVPVSSAALAADLGAAVVPAAPAALAATISASISGTALSVTAPAASALAMTTLQKSLVAAAVAVLAGAGLYEAHLFAADDDARAHLASATTAAAADLNAARRALAEASTRLRDTEQAIDARLAAARSRLATSDPALETQIQIWLDRVGRLRAYLERHPAHRTPELALLRDDAWFEVVRKADIPDDEAARRALGQIRLHAVNLVANRLQPAFQAYLRAHGQTLPAQLADLAPHFDPPLDPTLLSRFRLQHQGKLTDLAPDARNNLVALAFPPADPEHDFHLTLGDNGFSMTAAIHHNVSAARRAFAAANAGRRPETLAELRPHLLWPADDTLLARAFAPAERTPAQTPAR